MGLFSHHLLSAILLTPAVGAALLLFVPNHSGRLLRTVAKAIGVLCFSESLILLLQFPTGFAGFTFRENFEWIPSLGAEYSLGVDGISLFLTFLTCLLGMIAILMPGSRILRAKEFYIFLFLMQAGTLGIFVSEDLFLFYSFWTFSLIPAYFLIEIWGSERRLNAGLKFVLYNMAGAVALLLAILALHFNANGGASSESFDIAALIQSGQMLSHPLKMWILAGFCFSFAIRTALFPFHLWLADALAEVPAAIAVLLAGILIKTGTYGFIRLVVPLLLGDPELRNELTSIVGLLCISGFIYGAVICVREKEVRSFLHTAP